MLRVMLIEFLIYLRKKFIIPDENAQQAEADFIDIFKEKLTNERKMNIVLSEDTLKDLIKRLNFGEGHDGIHNLFLKRISPKILKTLKIFLNCCYSHSYIPALLLKGTITPFVKDRKKNINKSSNYRSVKQSSCLLKIMEMRLYDTLSDMLPMN